jgi:uncharacterized membrane protein
MTLDFFWGVLIAGCIGGVLGACVGIAAQWRETDINRWGER